MLLDILIFIPILLCVLFGLRDGIVRKVVAIVVLIGGLILGQLYMHDMGTFLIEHAGASQENASRNGFEIIFLGLLIIQSFLYRIVAKNYKIGGIADRIGGILLGFIEGILFASTFLFIYATADFPDRTNKHDSQFYKPIVNIAPQILDLTSSIGPDTFEELKEMGTSRAIEVRKKIQGASESGESSSAAKKRKQQEKADKKREPERK